MEFEFLEDIQLVIFNNADITNKMWEYRYDFL